MMEDLNAPLLGRPQQPLPQQRKFTYVYSMYFGYLSRYCDGGRDLAGIERRVQPPVDYDRETLENEAEFKRNAYLMGFLSSVFIIVFYSEPNDWEQRARLWFSVFGIFCLANVTFLQIFLRRSFVSRIWYTVSMYPIDVVIIGMFIYGFVIFSRMPDRCAETNPITYYLLTLILIILFGTFLKYISGIILLCWCLPVVTYIIIRDFRQRRDQEQNWEDFERNIFNNLRHLSIGSDIEQQHDSCCICLINFERGDDSGTILWALLYITRIV